MRERLPAFERMLWRACRGKLFFNFFIKKKWLNFSQKMNTCPNHGRILTFDTTICLNVKKLAKTALNMEKNIL